MKILDLALGALALGLGLACSTTQSSRSASAEPEGQRAEPAASASTAPLAPGEIERAPGEQRLSGRVARSTPDALVIDTDDGLQRTVAVPDDAAIVVNGQQASLADLAPGADVRVSYDEREDGRQIATRVEASQGTPGGMGSNAPASPGSAGGREEGAPASPAGVEPGGGSATGPDIAATGPGEDQESSTAGKW
ncbi:prolipoprotein diacylglyceryl transferase [Anaeromyxobacter oryzisoli]|uniref:hypothetical protein n=1 Tax=Anaeromyxobacter oryzisoli TaxID=2925408 RepID=UPI001F56492C|nr:hypothetical protein [Anaeromyxobacter sp. SG63]